MKKIISMLIIAAMLVSMSGCGKKESTGSSVVGEGKEKTEATLKPTTDPNATQAPMPTASATQEPFTDSDEATVVTAQEIPVAETKKEFDRSDETPGYVKYTSGDKKWGILLPEDAVSGDEDEGGVIFMLNQNMIAVNTMDEPIEMKSVAEAKQYFSILADNIKINRFNVIYDGDDYAGCSFDFETPIGAFGFGKYVVKGKTAASAAAINLADDGALNDVLRDTVNSLVVFE